MRPVLEPRMFAESVLPCWTKHRNSHKALFAGTWRDGQGAGARYFIPPSKGSDYNQLLETHLGIFLS